MRILIFSFLLLLHINVFALIANDNTCISDATGFLTNCTDTISNIDTDSIKYLYTKPKFHKNSLKNDRNKEQTNEYYDFEIYNPRQLSLALPNETNFSWHLTKALFRNTIAPQLRKQLIQQALANCFTRQALPQLATQFKHQFIKQLKKRSGRKALNITTRLFKYGNPTYNLVSKNSKIALSVHKTLSKHTLNYLNQGIWSGLTSQIGMGALSGAVFSYGAYFTGNLSLQQANRNFIADITSSTVGASAYATATFLVLNYGSVSTLTAASSLLGAGTVSFIGSVVGTSTLTTVSTWIGSVSISSIAGISGTAATTATTAWFGGGALASGGLGATAGSAVLTGGIALVAVAAAMGTQYLFVLHDEHIERKRVDKMVTSITLHINEERN